MKLIGMLDSPYVRRVAVSLALYGVEFEHLPLSVFSAVEPFAKFNPVVKAPTLILDNAVRLMDSTLILHYFESQADLQRKLLPAAGPALAEDLQTLDGFWLPAKKPYSRFTNTAYGRQRNSINRGLNASPGSYCLPAGNGTPRWNAGRSTRRSIRSR
ncbi:glutathione S-transferase domain protein [Raoultella ornithinolytica]|nr:glutathione S-transferase domain protein [Raoultella ornithinolytica]